MKKTILSFLTLILIFVFNGNAQVSINNDGSSPETSAMFEVKSTSKGFLPPRMTTAERDAISSPTDGLVIYNTQTECLEFYKVGSWISVCGGTGSPSGSYTLDGSGTCIDIVPNGNYYIGVGLGVTHTVDIDVTFSAPGYWSITTNTLNGYSFSGSGTIGTAGSHTLTLDGSGTPIAGQTDSFTGTANGGAGNFTFAVGVISPSVINFGGDSYYEVVGACGRVWLDRNLGASRVALSISDASAYGDTYQWGRLTDGHESRTSGSTSVLSTTNVPGHGLYIDPSSSPYDWRSPQNINLWQGVTGINNPCPSGFRIPEKAEWELEKNTWSPVNNTGGYNSVLKTTNGGVRDHSFGWFAVNSYGFYWSSTVDGTKSGLLELFPAGAVVTNYDRASAGSVRCIED